MIPSVGPTELLILLAVVLLLFGAKRIPSLARSLGSGAREFREGISGKGEKELPATDRAGQEEAASGMPATGTEQGTT